MANKKSLRSKRKNVNSSMNGEANFLKYHPESLKCLHFTEKIYLVDFEFIENILKHLVILNKVIFCLCVKIDLKNNLSVSTTTTALNSIYLRGKNKSSTWKYQSKRINILPCALEQRLDKSCPSSGIGQLQMQPSTTNWSLKLICTTRRSLACKRSCLPKCYII